MQASPTKTIRRLLKKSHSSPQVAGKSSDHVSEILPYQPWSGAAPTSVLSGDVGAGPVYNPSDTPVLSCPTPHYNYVRETPPPPNKTVVNPEHKLPNIPELRANDAVSRNTTDSASGFTQVDTAATHSQLVGRATRLVRRVLSQPAVGTHTDGGPPFPKVPTRSPWPLPNIPEPSNDAVSRNTTDGFTQVDTVSQTTRSQPAIGAHTNGGRPFPEVSISIPWRLPNIPEPPNDVVSRNPTDSTGRFTKVDTVSQATRSQPTGTPAGLELQLLGTTETAAGVHAAPGNYPGTGIDIPVSIPRTPGDDAPPQTSLWLRPLPVDLAPSPSIHSQQSIYSAKIPNHNPIVSNHKRVVEAIAKLKFASQSDDSFRYFHVQNGRLHHMQSTQYMQQIRASLSPSAWALIQGMEVFLLRYDSTRDVQLQLDRHDFLKLMEANYVPSDFIEILSNNNGSAVFHATTKISKMSPVSHQDKSFTEKYKEVYWKSPKNPYNDSCIYFRHQPSTELTTMIVLANRILLLRIEERLQEIFTPLGPDNDIAITIQPNVLLSTIISERSALLESDRKRLQNKVTENESKTGIGCYVYDKHARLQTRDMAPLMNGLYTLEGLLRLLCKVYEFELKLTQRLQEELKRPKKEPRWIDTEECENQDTQWILKSLQLTDTFLSNGLQETKLMQERTQIQLSVIRTMLAQHDSETSVSIAKESKSIAAETREDSTSMKTVAGMTLIFLPATFAASLFSTNFFARPDTSSQKPGDLPRLKVAGDWWIYAAVTIPLTLLVVAVWTGWLRWERHRKEEKRALEGRLQGTSLGDIEAGGAVPGINKKAE